MVRLERKGRRCGRCPGTLGKVPESKYRVYGWVYGVRTSFMALQYNGYPFSLPARGIGGCGVKDVMNLTSQNKARLGIEAR